MGDLASGGGWRTIVIAKREQQRLAIGPYLRPAISSSNPLPYPASIAAEDDVERLLTRLASGTLKAEDVTAAYIQKAIVAHQATNCLTEILFSDALDRARYLDEYFESNGRVIGPLHGIPVTLKDQFNVKGLDTTLGYVGRAYAPATEDAAIVDTLRDLGAVILAKTNLPQSIMWCETENPLWGLTTHPHNPAYTPGGSTGGEGSLLALHGSMVGWGTDIGGSIRIPANLNGLYGLKPSSGRLPYYGVPVSMDGQEHVPSVIGPMTRNLSSLTYVMKTVIDTSPWRKDPRCVAIPWRDVIYQEAQKRPLVVGLFLDDGVVRPHPPMERVLRTLETKLKEAGHAVVLWDPAGHKECIDIMDAYYTIDGGEDIRRDVLAGGEPFLPHVEALVNRTPAITVHEYWRLNRRKLAAQKAYLDKWNAAEEQNGHEIDVLLTPVFPSTAVPHRTCRWVGYTKIWNLLDYTALAIPAGHASKTLDRPLADIGYKPKNEIDAWNWNLWDPVAMDGLPVGLQLVGRRFEEEKVLGAAKVIMELLIKP